MKRAITELSDTLDTMCSVFYTYEPGAIRCIYDRYLKTGELGKMNAMINITASIKI